MRKLTIVRKKKLIACAMKVYIYLESKTDEDLVLGGITCEKIGTIKNGQRFSIEIPSTELNVFIVYDKFFPTKYNCRYLLPLGDDDVTLYTAPKFDPFSGNPFEISRQA